MASAHPVLHTSPLRRARDTACAIADALGADVHVLPDLQEIDCGALDGRSVAEVQASHPDLWAANLRQDADDFRWPGGESYQELRERSVQASRNLLAAYPGRTVLAITHAGVVSQILGELSGVPAARWSAFRPGNASITELVQDGNGISMKRFDDRRHLPAGR